MQIQLTLWPCAGAWAYLPLCTVGILVRTVDHDWCRRLPQKETSVFPEGDNPTTTTSQENLDARCYDVCYCAGVRNFTIWESPTVSSLRVLFKSREPGSIHCAQDERVIAQRDCSHYCKVSDASNTKAENVISYEKNQRSLRIFPPESSTFSNVGHTRLEPRWRWPHEGRVWFELWWFMSEVCEKVSFSHHLETSRTPLKSLPNGTIFQ